MGKKVSIICPILNEEQYIVGCIESILSQDYPKEKMEVILVDGMSTDGTREIVSRYVQSYGIIKMVDNPAGIVPPAMNIGIRASSGDIIVRMDAHAKFPMNYVSELVVYLERLKADNVGGVCRTLPVKDTLICKAIANVLSSKFGMGNSYFRVGATDVMQVDTVPFGCFHRDLFDRIGFFDEDLVRNQDDEFNGRIIKNGGKIYLLPQVVIDYYSRDSIKKVYQMFFQYGLFKPLVNKKLGRPASIRQFFPVSFVLGLFLGFVLGLFFPFLFVPYLFVIILYCGLATAFSLKSTRDVKQILIQNWTFFIVHFSYGFGFLKGLFHLVSGKSLTVKANR